MEQIIGLIQKSEVLILINLLVTPIMIFDDLEKKIKNN